MPAHSSQPFLLRVLGALALTLLCPAVSATTYVMMSDPDLADQAEAIVEVKILSGEPTADASVAATDYLVEVDRLIKGFVPGSSLIVRVVGVDREDGPSLRIWGAPRFVPGDSALLFLLPNADGSFGILHLMLGSFHRVDHAGTSYAIRDLEEATEIANPLTGKRLLDERRPRDLEAFSNWLADRAEGNYRSADYFRDAPAGLGRQIEEKFTLITDRVVNQQIRWFQFDNGGAVTWFAHTSGQEGVAGGGFNSFRAALNAWNADSNTPIQLSYGGTTSANGGFGDNLDGRNTILFNDPNGEIDGTFRCGQGGILAIGGPRYFREISGTFNDRAYLRTQEAEVITNDGISCYLGRGPDPAKVAEEIFGHEIGHTLGLGHSCGDNSSPACEESATLDDALMRAQAHGDGRGALPNRDDLAGARALYRSTTGGGGGGGGGGKPTAPTNLTAVNHGLEVQLTWQDNATNETGFRIYRQTGSGAFAQVGDMPANAAGFLDRNLSPGTTYGYQVAAFNSNGERRSATVNATTPALVPITVSVLAPQGNLEAGLPVSLIAEFTGPAESARWTLGDEGLGVSAEPCGANRFCLQHIFRSAATFTVRVVATGEVGQTAESSRGVNVAAATTTPLTSRSLIQSVIFGPRGNTGTFKSDCWLHNAGTADALVRLAFLPRGGAGNGPSRDLTVAHGNSVLLSNVVSSVFGLTDSQGAIDLTYQSAAAPDVRTLCRSYVELPGSASSFGLFVPENLEPSWTGDAKVVTGVLEGNGFSANVQALNVDDRAGAVIVELVDAAGQTVGGPVALALGSRSMRSRPVGQIFPAAQSATGPFTARFTSDGIRFVASVTLLELTSEDQIYINAAPSSSANTVYLPRISRSQSQFNAFLVSQLMVKNLSAQPTTLNFELWQRGQANLTPRTATRIVPGNGTLTVPDVIQGLFGLAEGVGALKVVWSNSDNLAPRIQTYSFNQSQGGSGLRFGMLVDAQPASAATSGTSVDFGGEQSDLFRADFGILNLSQANSVVRVRLKEADGDLLATRDLTLLGQQHLERNIQGIFPETPILDEQNFLVETEVLSGGAIFTYLANINASGDIFFVPGKPRSPSP